MAELDDFHSQEQSKMKREKKRKWMKQEPRKNTAVSPKVHMLTNFILNPMKATDWGSVKT